MRTVKKSFVKTTLATFGKLVVDVVGRRSCGCQCGVLLRRIYSGWGCVSDVVRCSCGILLRDICSGWCCISDVVRCSCGILKNSTSTSHIAGNATPPRTNVTKKNSTLTVTNVTFTTGTTTTTTTRPPRTNVTNKNSTAVVLCFVFVCFLCFFVVMRFFGWSYPIGTSDSGQERPPTRTWHDFCFFFRDVSVKAYA